jgi:hypothetical protein
MSTHAKPYHPLDMHKRDKWKQTAPTRWQWTGESWVDEIYNYEPNPLRRGIARELVGSLMISTLIVCFILALSGCYGSPIDTRAIDADKVTITHATPWTTLTIQAEGWHSTVKTLDGKDMGAGNSQALRNITGQGVPAAVQTIPSIKLASANTEPPFRPIRFHFAHGCNMLTKRHLTRLFIFAGPLKNSTVNDSEPRQRSRCDAVRVT